MTRAAALIIVIFSFISASAQSTHTAGSELLSMNTGIAPSNYNTSNESSVLRNNYTTDVKNSTDTYSGTLEFKRKNLKGMKPLLLVGNSILINPDPAVDRLTILNDELPVNEVRIENATGELVVDKKTGATIAGVEVNINISTLPSGLYFITTLSGDRTVTGNIIVIR
jgi:hypothetical protein